MSSTALETGLPNPSYLKLEVARDGLGKSKVQRAVLQRHTCSSTLLKTDSTLMTESPVPELSAERKYKHPLHHRQVQAYARDRDKEQDVKALMLRQYLNPQRFYKNLASLNGDLQVGTVVGGSGLGGDIPRRQRRKTLVDEILADQAVRSYAKRKYTEVQAVSSSGRRRKPVKHKRKRT